MNQDVEVIDLRSWPEEMLHGWTEYTSKIKKRMVCP